MGCRLGLDETPNNAAMLQAGVALDASRCESTGTSFVVPSVPASAALELEEDARYWEIELRRLLETSGSARIARQKIEHFVVSFLFKGISATLPNVSYTILRHGLNSNNHDAQ